MANKSLKDFYNDSETRENVYNYLIQFLETVAIQRVFEKQDAIGIGEAKEIIDKAFENLDNLFEPKTQKKEQVNEAR